MGDLTEDYVKRWFTEYYRKNLDEIVAPIDLEHREFGFLIFKGKRMIRHKSFTGLSELKQFIAELIPSDVYHSAAYYERPDEEMNKKGLMKADLVFDIDADHLNIPCRSEHDRWICSECSELGKGIVPEICPKCKGRTREESWICKDCLTAAKKETIKLIDFLKDDFGFSDDDIKINFTGHRGYHIHVINEDAAKLGREERKEIVDYLTGVGLDIDLLRSYIKDGSTNVSNWVKRIHSKIDKEKNHHPMKKLTVDSIEKIVDETSIKIDTVVTTDVHRLIRLVGTLNSKTGMKVVNVPIPMLDFFDPFTDAIALRGRTVKLFIKEAPHFTLGDNEYGPYKNIEKELPIAAATLLICKDRARPILHS